MPEPLSVRLREATRTLHEVAESSAIFRSIMDGTIRREDYGAYLAHLAPVYAALEAGLEANRENPALAPLFLPEVFRTAALREDLTALEAGPASASEVAIAGRVLELAQAGSPRLAAYFYIRYFGDLSGGQILSRLLARALDLTVSRGLAFYEFPALGPSAAAKNTLRNALDALPLEEKDIEAIVDEARDGFQAHVDLFAALERSVTP